MEELLLVFNKFRQCLFVPIKGINRFLLCLFIITLKIFSLDLLIILVEEFEEWLYLLIRWFWLELFRVWIIREKLSYYYVVSFYILCVQLCYYLLISKLLLYLPHYTLIYPLQTLYPPIPFRIILFVILRHWWYVNIYLIRSNYMLLLRNYVFFFIL